MRRLLGKMLRRRDQEERTLSDWTPRVIERWQTWRNEDHEDNAVISRSDVITLLTEIERLRAALNGRIEVATDLQMKLAAERERCARIAEARIAVASPVRQEGEA